MNDNKEEFKQYMLKEIDLIQDIIKRMATNSFWIKGWTVTLVVATLVLKGSEFQVFIAFIPLMAFWVLDAYFLRQERLFRKLYDWVINNRLNSDENLFNMNTSRFEKDVQTISRIVFSKTLSWFYGSITLMLIIYSFFLILCHKGRCCYG